VPNDQYPQSQYHPLHVAMESLLTYDLLDRAVVCYNGMLHLHMFLGAVGLLGLISFTECTCTVLLHD